MQSDLGIFLARLVLLSCSKFHHNLTISMQAFSVSFLNFQLFVIHALSRLANINGFGFFLPMILANDDNILKVSKLSFRLISFYV